MELLNCTLIFILQAFKRRLKLFLSPIYTRARSLCFKQHLKENAYEGRTGGITELCGRDVYH